MDERRLCAKISWKRRHEAKDIGNEKRGMFYTVEDELVMQDCVFFMISREKLGAPVV